ncbi:MAG: hypothetical protein R3B09_14230 [Nannocystaceae bacterium]
MPSRRSVALPFALILACSGGAESSATQTSGSTGDTETTSETTDTTADVYAHALLFDHAAYLQTPHAPESPLGSGEADTAGVELDPATLHLFLSDDELSCAVPEPQWPCAGYSTWDHLAIPPERQAIGVYAVPGDLVGRIYIACNDDDCGCLTDEHWIASEGSLEITAIDESAVSGRRCSSARCVEFTAARC